MRISHVFENLDQCLTVSRTANAIATEVGKKNCWCFSVVKNVEVLWADRWVSVKARSVFLEVGHSDVILRQLLDTMLTMRAMVFFVSEFAYCALGTGPIAGVQQVSIWSHFLLIHFGLLDVTPFVAMSIFFSFPIGSSV